jgi:hypothetical protein
MVITAIIVITVVRVITVYKVIEKNIIVCHDMRKRGWGGVGGWV